MNRTLPIVLPLLLLMAACHASPAARWGQAREAVTRGQNVLLALHDAKQINDAEYMKATDVLLVARRSLAAAQVYIEDGGQAFDIYLAAVDGALVEIARQAAERQWRKEDDDAR